MIYLVLFLTFIICIFINEYSHRKIEKPLFIAMCVLLGTIAAMRYKVGLDYSGYLSIFRVAKRNSQNINISMITFLGEKIGVEKFFVLINILMARIGIRAEVFIGIMSVITIVIIGYVILRESVYPFFSLMIFYLTAYLQMLNISRQFISIALVLFAVTMLQKKKYVLYAAAQVLAILVHTSALVALCYVILNKLKFNYKVYWLYIMTAIAIFFFEDDMIEVLARFGVYSDLLQANRGLKPFTIVPSLVLVVLVGLYMNRLTSKKENHVYMHAVMISFIIAILSLRLFYFSRVSYYFTITLVLFVPILVEAVREARARFIVVCGYVFMMGAIFINNALELSNKYLPYNSVKEAIDNGFIR